MAQLPALHDCGIAVTAQRQDYLFIGEFSIF